MVASDGPGTGQQRGDGDQSAGQGRVSIATTMASAAGASRRSAIEALYQHQVTSTPARSAARVAGRVNRQPGAKNTAPR